ncbi:MAG: glycine cleavage system protein H [Sulfuricella sp.]|nr:glycine cleavage system protein H [Sulfuricella sp.]
MAREPFCGAIPADRRYDPRYDMWVLHDGDKVVVGATSFGLFLAGKVIAFTAKPRGAQVEQGRGLGTVESAKTVIAVHAPLSFVLEEANELAEDRPQIINDDPYGGGWMARGTPLDWEAESAALVDAAAYVAHLRAMEPDARVEP